MYFYSAPPQSICCRPITDSQKQPPGTFDVSSLLSSITLLPFLYPLSTICPSDGRFSVHSDTFCAICSLQVMDTDVSNVGTMIECGLFAEALESIRSDMYPGLLPPARCLVSLLEYVQQVGLDGSNWKKKHNLASNKTPGIKVKIWHEVTLRFIVNLIIVKKVYPQKYAKFRHIQIFGFVLFIVSKGNATAVFQKNLMGVMFNLLVTNPPWLSPNAVKKYFTQVLQCPVCKTGLWPFLETAIR